MHLRARLIDYFVIGEMARPPRLAGSIPEVTADWQWRGVWPVTTDAVLTGAWRVTRQNRLALLFVNVSDQPVEVTFDFDATTYGLAGEQFVFRSFTVDGQKTEFESPACFTTKLKLDAKSACVWETKGGRAEE